MHVRQRAQEYLHGLRGLVDDVLAVVEQQQRALAAQCGFDEGERRDVAFCARAKRARDRMRDKRRVGHRREFHEPDPIVERAGQLAGRLDCQACLAGPARTDQRDQPRLACRLADLCQRLPASDETRQRRRQVRAQRFLRADRWEFRAQAWHDKLVEPFGARKPAQGVIAKIA